MLMSINFYLLVCSIWCVVASCVEVAATWLSWSFVVVAAGKGGFLRLSVLIPTNSRSGYLRTPSEDVRLYIQRN